jgi:hypothetical protein
MTEGFAVRADIRGHQVVIDQPEAARGQNQGPTPAGVFFVLARWLYLHYRPYRGDAAED